MNLLIIIIICCLLQSLLTTGGSGWSEMKDGSVVGTAPGSGQPAGESWNVEVFVDVVKELVGETVKLFNFLAV